MRLDHVSYVASHDQISDVVNRIGSQIGTTFIDGGIHPKFGTRNFIAPLLNEQYIEVVCPLDHPATEKTPFGKAVKKKSEEGGGWMAWVIATDDISLIEGSLGRKAVDGQRKKPNGSLLHWKQVGVLDTLDDSSQPFYIEWISKEHPSKDGKSSAKLIDIIIEVEQTTNFRHLIDFNNLFISPSIKFIKPESNFVGIKEIRFDYDNKEVIIN